MTEAEPANGAAKWRVEVSRACISSGICLTVAPNRFEFVGVRARPTTGLIHSAEDAELVRDAGEECPVGAISLLDESART